MHITTTSHDSTLGVWTHSECKPPPLRDVVQNIWHFEGKTALLRERSFPKVHSEIILHLGPRFRDVSDAGVTLDYFPTACFGGPTTVPTVIQAPDEICCVIGIQLTPAGAFLLRRTSAECTRNVTVDVRDVFGDDAVGLTEECHEAPTVAERLAIICRWVTRAAREAKPMHQAVAWVATNIANEYGAVNIGRFQEATTLSKARFATLFREQVGLLPKQYARIVRFRKSLSLLQDGFRLSDTALRAGYFDQAHMYRDFAEFARCTPLEFVRAVRFPGSLSVGESS